MFKFIVLAAFVGLAASAAVSASDDAHAETKSLLNEISPEGVFHYAYATSNGIDVDSAGDEHAVKGSITWLSPEGEEMKLTYVADENGYRPEGALLPTPPPTPEAIIRAIEYNLAHPVAEESSNKRVL